MKFNRIGKGCIICASVIITVNTNIGNFVILNLSCTVGHDTNIWDFSSFMPTVTFLVKYILVVKYMSERCKNYYQLDIGDRTIVGAGQCSQISTF